MKIVILEGSPNKNGSSNMLAEQFRKGAKDVGRILRTFKIKKNVEVTDNGKIII